MKIKNNLFYAGMIILLLVGAGFFLVSTGQARESGITGEVIGSSGDVQVVKMSVVGSGYVFEPSTVKAGVPVRIEADMSRMPGCSRSVVISEFGVRKTFTSSDNILEFTPTKAGKFYVACSMNMYKGTLEVLESDGAKSTYVQSVPSGGSTCGMGGGGCGCGGSR